ncbi:ammonium transporter [Mucilaginibacter sp. BT774]|uniref:ammonium transporter n=1 Tax=Mucilaginibacter sp. BT774 TaxID=3062276 RepID=UPI002675955F|nr:ammonium transporter [Mucilaginibacter sp. BT774]MDO3627682.1 ammonium transporter [Mucilaginibacter sp. BT774]
MNRKIFTLLLVTILTISFSSTIAQTPRKPDPAGVTTGTSADIDPTSLKVVDTIAKTKDTTVAAVNSSVKKLATAVSTVANADGKNKVAINLVWLLITGFLVFFMQAGFALVETGLTRAKNVAHTMAMNLFVYPAGVLGFFICGFAIMFGGVGALGTLGGFDGLNQEFSINLFGHAFGLFGTKGFFMNGVYDVGVLGFFVFQAVFMDATATIPTGAMAERWKFASFAISGVLIGGLIYPIYGNWVWGGGWLSQLGANFGLGHGHLDFAGSSVVHLSGGVLAFVGARMIGPRLGKYNKDKTPNAIPGHNIPMAVLGTLILAFGWFGFNAGSTFAGTDFRFAVVAFNTMVASCGGVLASTLWIWFVRGSKPDVSMMCNGLLAGLVAITAPCAYVTPIGGLVIGLISGIIVVEVTFFMERKLRIDDPVGAVAVHGANGIWGVLALGLFADGQYGDGFNGVKGTVTGLFYGGGWGQFIAEAIGALTNLVFIGLAGWLMFKFLNLIVGNRVKPEIEMYGLDLPEMGIDGYSGIRMDKNAETPLSR